MLGEPQCLRHKWYFSRQEIEDHSPSRKDGIEYEHESELRKLYCSFLQELGMELKVPQVTIATAMMLCHRFYMCQSHAKNDWQIIAVVSMFLACKAEETPRWLSDVAVVAYKLMYKWDPSASRRIKQRDVYDKQKELIVNGERLLLSTIAFDLNIEHPYKPLVTALKRWDISNKKLAEVAWNFVNDWLRTTLSLQYKPHYIAAGSIFLAAKFQKVKLPKEKGKAWWMEFDVSPKQLEEVIQQMLGWLEKNRKQALPPTHGKKLIESKPTILKTMPNVSQSAIICRSNVSQYVGHGAPVDARGSAKPATSSSPHSCILSSSNVAECTDHGAMVDGGALAKSVISNSQQSYIISSSSVTQDAGHGATVNTGRVIKSAMPKCSENEAFSRGFYVGMQESFCCPTSDCGSTNSAVEDGDGEPKSGESVLNSSSKIISVQGGESKVDVDRIRETLKRRRCDKILNKKLVETIDDEMVDGEAWIERELENGIEVETVASLDKRRRF